MITNDPIGCQSSETVATVARQAGFTSAFSNNSFAFGSCDDVCPYQLDQNSCPGSLPCLKLNPDHNVFTVCSKTSDSSFVVHEHRDIFHENTTYKILKLDHKATLYSYHENWCRDYQKLCESYGLRPVAFDQYYEYRSNYGTPGKTYHAVVQKNIYFSSSASSILYKLAKVVGFPSASSSNTFAIYQTESSCPNYVPYSSSINSYLYVFYGSQRSEKYTACTDGASSSAFKVLETREVTHQSIQFLALQVKIPRQVKKNWCREYQSLCESFNKQPIGCSVKYKYEENTLCRDEYRAVTPRADILGCPSHAKAAEVVNMAGFSEAGVKNTFVFHECDQCISKDPLCSSDFADVSCLDRNLSDSIAYTLCAEPEGAFSVLSTTWTTFQQLPYLALHVRVPKDGRSKFNNWCTEYKELCALYGLKPTGCGTDYSSATYMDCETTYSSIRPINNDLSCDPSSMVQQIVYDAGYHQASTSYSFAFQTCSSSCTNTISTSCSQSLYCLRTSHVKREAHTVCRGARPVFGGITGQVKTTYNGQQYHVFRLTLPNDGKSVHKNWCKEYQMLCKSYGLRPTGCGRSRLGDAGMRECREQYHSVMTDDQLGCDPRDAVSRIAVNAGFTNATIQNSFAFYNCSDCPRVLPSSGCTGGLYCLNRNIAGGTVYTVCTDSDSNFIVHDTKEHVSQGTNFLVVKAEVPATLTSQASNWCLDYQKLCRSYGRLPTGVSGQHHDDPAATACKSYFGSVMLEGSSNIPWYPNSEISNIILNSKIRTYTTSSRSFGFGRCSTSTACPATISSSCFNDLYCFTTNTKRITHALCTDPDSNFRLIDDREYTHLGRNYTVIHASVPDDGTSKHNTWCHDYQRLCESFVKLPLTCGSDSWRKKDFYQCRDEYGAAIFDENAVGCDSNDDAVIIARGAGFTGATNFNTIMFHNCSSCSKYLIEKPDEAVYPLRKGIKEIYALCTDSNSNFEVLKSSAIEYNGVPYTALQLRTPVNGLSRHENWCRDYERLCATFGQRPTGCGETYKTQSGYGECGSIYNSSMPWNNHFSCAPYGNIKHAIYNFFKASTTSNTFGFSSCTVSGCPNLLPSSGTIQGLFGAYRSESVYLKHTLCVDKKPGFKYISQNTYLRGDTSYLIVKAELPSTGKSQYENWCRDYEKLCSMFARRPLACGNEKITEYKHRSCRTLYNGVMPFDGYTGCGPNVTLLAQMAVSAGYTDANTRNVFAMRSCDSCSDSIPASGANEHLYSINMQVQNRDVYAFCVHSDSNFQVLKTKSVVFRSWKYLAVKVKIPSNSRSQHENWCRDYQRMCESFGKRPVASISVDESTEAMLDCRLSYNAYLPDSTQAWIAGGYSYVYSAVLKAKLGITNQYQAFSSHKCLSYCSKTMTTSGCQSSLRCMSYSYLKNKEAYTLCADSDSGFEVVFNKTTIMNGTEYLVIGANVPLYGRSRYENWCRDYQKLCQSYGRRPLACGNKYQHDSQYTRCRDEYNGLMFHDDNSPCNQNEKVMIIARHAGYINANKNNSFAFHACEQSDCPQSFGQRFTRSFYSAGTHPVDRLVYTVCVNADANLDIILAKPQIYSSVDFLVIKARLPVNGESKYENWCRDYERLCDSYGMRPTGADMRYLMNSVNTRCRDKYRSVMLTKSVIPSPPYSYADTITSPHASTATSSNSFAFDKCLDQDCTKTLPQSTCSSSLNCIYQSVPNKFAHTMCVEPLTNFKILDQREVRYLSRNFLAIKATIKNTNATSKSTNWCLDYKILCESYGKRPLACPNSYASGHQYYRCQEEFNAVLMESSECPLNNLVADIANTAGFTHATPSNSFAFRSCNESACVRHLNDSGCDNALYCISRRVPNREVYTVCANTDSNFEVIHAQSVVYSSINYVAIKARLPSHGKPMHENWCKDYQALCESYDARPTGCGGTNINHPDYGRCASKYHSNMPGNDYFACTSTTNIKAIANSAGFTEATEANSFTFHNCSDAACNRDLLISGCHGSLHCLNSSFLNQEVFTVCRKLYESNFKVLQVKDTVYQGIAYKVIKARLPSSRYSHSSNWCYDYKHLCNSYGQSPTGCGEKYSGDSTYSSCASQYGSVMLPGNNLDCDPRVMVSMVARAAGFYNASYDNSFAFHRCTGYCSSAIPTSGCSSSLSCANVQAARHREVYTLCTDPSHSNFEVMDSRKVEHNGMRYTALKTRIPKNGISLNENWCRDYQRLCDQYGGRPTGCGAANKADTNCSLCSTIYDSFMPSNDFLGCNSTNTAAAIIAKSGFAGAVLENTFIFHQCDNSSCTKELPQNECSNSLNCISKNILAAEVYTLCLDKNQRHNFEVVKTKTLPYDGREYRVIEVKLPENSRSKHEDWCRDYQRLCESFGMRPTGCQSSSSAQNGFPGRCERYNSLIIQKNKSCLATEFAKVIANGAGFSLANLTNTIAFDDCSSNKCPTRLDGPDCADSDKPFCNLHKTSQSSAYAICVKANYSLEVRETRNIAHDGVTYKIIRAQLPQNEETKIKWCLEYQQVCESYGQRPMLRIEGAYRSESALMCRDQYNSILINATNETYVSVLANVAGFNQATRLNSFAFSRCSPAFCSASLINEKCGSTFDCIYNEKVSVPEFFHFACIKDLPVSNFEVLSTKQVKYNQDMYLVIQARLPSKGNSKFENWCRDYQKLCENYALRPLACSRDRYESEHEMALCLARYDAVMPLDTSLECPARQRVQLLAQKAGFGSATLGNSFALHRCTECTRFLNSSLNKGVYPLSIDVPGRVVYTVCTRDQSSNFEVVETRMTRFQHVEFLVIQARLPRFVGKSKQVDWCKDYQMLCESFGRRPVGRAAIYETYGVSLCSKLYNSFMLLNDEMPANIPSGVSQIALQAGFWRATTTNSFAFENCKDCSQYLHSSCLSTVGMNCLTHREFEVYTVCV